MNWLNPVYLWTLAAVPLVVALFLWAAWNRREAFRRLGDRTLIAKLSAAVSPRRRRWKAALVVIGIFFIAVALAGPRFGTKLREVKREGIDLMIVDLLARGRHVFRGGDGIGQEFRTGFEDQSGVFLGGTHRLGLSWGVGIACDRMRGRRRIEAAGT